jgi:putative ABC transport system permease protein
MALGAGASDVVRLVVCEGLRLAVVGVAIGGGAALVAGRAIARFLDQVAPRDPVTLIFVVGGVLAVVFVACPVPARRASRIPPAAALRLE